MRSVRTAQRLRALSWLVTFYGALLVVGGVIGGVLLFNFVRTTDSVITPEGEYVPAFTTRPYEWEGLAFAVGAVVVGTFVLVLAELIRLRAHSVIEDRGASRARSSRTHRETRPTSSSPSARSASAPVPAPAPANATAVRRSRRARGGERVQVLTASESELLAASAPPSSAEGWYPDPLGKADYRRWNGRQWTGEQRTIALPQT